MEIESLTSENLSKSKLKYMTTNLYITGKDINFSYKKELPILKNINFKINPREIVALVGPSGEGKTTLIRLILSLIHPVQMTRLIKEYFSHCLSARSAFPLDFHIFLLERQVPSFH